MNHLIVVVMALLCAGCATSVYDTSALSAAQQAKVRGYDRCNAGIATRQFTTKAALTDCTIAVEKAYAVAIKLRRMDLFEIYAAQVREIARAADAREISMQEADNRLVAAGNNYISAANQAYSQTEVQNAANSANAAIIGTALLGAAARAYAPPPPTIVNTSCTTSGGITNCTSF